MVGADEYVREDELPLPGSSGTASGDTQEEEDDKQNEEDNLCHDQNENEIDFWDFCLATITEQNQVNNLNGVGNEEVMQIDCEDNIGEEDLCENRVATLSTLPVTNNPAYRQENEQYFVTKKQVRKDKFALSTMIFMELSIPTLSSIYQ